MKEYQKPLKRKGLALFPKEKGKTARIRREASEGSFGRKRTVFWRIFIGKENRISAFLRIAPKQATVKTIPCFACEKYEIRVIFRVPFCVLHSQRNQRNEDKQCQNGNQNLCDSNIKVHLLMCQLTDSE